MERIRETLELIDRVVKEHNIPSNITGSRDEKDNYLLALSETVPLDYLITDDRDLLVLEQWQETKIINFTSFKELIEQMN